MEGRACPPKAEHPFPFRPDLNKFFGTKLSTGYFKVSAACLCFIALWQTQQYYGRKGTHGLFGDQGVPRSAEMLQKRIHILNASSKLRMYDYRVKFNSAKGDDFKYDEGIKRVIPTKEVADKVVWQKF